MSSLSDLPEVIGFFSYSREDDQSYKGRLSALREGIQDELSAQLGRSKTTFRLWQDREAIAPGRLWESEIKTAVEQSVFFIPIVTPRAVNSNYCKFEFEAFLARERALGRTDLVFPILYVPVPALQNETQWRDHPVLSAIAKRQYVDWQTFRYSDVNTPAMREAVGRFCLKIVEALYVSWLSPEERQRLEDAAANERTEDQRRQQEAKAEEETRRRKDETEAEAQRMADDRRRQEGEAKRRAAENEARGKREAEAVQRAEAAPRPRATRVKERAEEERAFAAAKANNTIKMLDAFLEIYPESHRSSEAEILRARLVERGADADRGARDAEAKQRAEEKRAFVAVMANDTIRMVDAFLDTYPKGPLAEQAQILRERLVQRDEAFKKAISSDDPGVLEAFINHYPASKLAEQIRNRLRRL
jgi:hypothetical protein